MKFNDLRSIGHNLADSLASGESRLIGFWDVNPFTEAGRRHEGFIDVDFLSGTTPGFTPSECFARAITLFSEALPELCRKHGVLPSASRRLDARYDSDLSSRSFVVTVEDQVGRRATDRYVGSPGRRVRVLDPLGRIRTDRGQVVLLG